MRLPFEHWIPTDQRIPSPMQHQIVSVWTAKSFTMRMADGQYDHFPVQRLELHDKPPLRFEMLGLFIFLDLLPTP